MTQALHSQARTTHLIREEIRNSTLSQAELARLYNVTRQTIRKWQNRDSPEDRSHAPVKMYTTLSPEQELIVVELRKTLLLPTDDLLTITREFINPAVSRAGLGRCLRRHGVSDLRDLVEQESAAPVTKKTFKDYEPGFVHIDIKYLPQMPDETSRRYLFVAIDRATRWVYIDLYADQTDSSSVDFLAKVQQACPVKIIKLLTDNGSQFTDRFTAGGKKKEPSGTHVFDRLCKQLGIEHRLIPPRHPQTNGMVERFNGRISDIVNQTRFGSAAELESTLRNYVKIYNHSIPQRALKHKAPVQALKDWREKRPELFRKRVYNQPGLDKYSIYCASDTVTVISNHAQLEAFGRELLSPNFFMREFLQSEIAAWHGLRNVPDFPDIALDIGKKLCQELLEPLQTKFGKVHVRSGYRSPAVNQCGNEHGLNCASKEKNYAGHIRDYPDAAGLCGATACIVMPALVDRHGLVDP